jgi:large subunit ribosomal protein L15
VEYNEVNLDQIADLPAGSAVDPETLAKARLLRDTRKPVVILGRGDINIALSVKAHRVTKSAKAKIEAAGGTVEILDV